MNNLGTLIKKLRLKKGISQRELSRISGVSNAEISRLESGMRKNINITVISSILNSLDIQENDEYTNTQSLISINEIIKCIDTLRKCNVEIR